MECFLKFRHVGNYAIDAMLWVCMGSLDASNFNVSGVTFEQ
jgi:hypothetical protein